MRSSKTALYGGLVVATALATVVAGSAGAAKKPKIPTCASWADAAGDAAPSAPVVGNPSGQPADKAVDITKVAFLNDGKKLTAEITVPEYAQRPTYAYGNAYEVQFVLDGKTVVVYYNDSGTRDEEANVFYQAGVKVDGTNVKDSDALVSETAGSGKVSVSIVLADLAGVVGSKITKATTVTAALVRSRGTYVGLLSTMDTATAPDTLKIPLSVCK